MKISKKLSLFVATVLLCSYFAINPANAETLQYKNDKTNISNEITYDENLKDKMDTFYAENYSDEINPLKEVTCDNSPTGWHEAFARGYGILYRGNNSSDSTLVYDNGCTWQCPYCYMVIVTKGEAALGYPIGYYATYNPGKPTSMYGVTLYSNDIFYSSSSKLSGVHFRYN